MNRSEFQNPVVAAAYRRMNREAEQIGGRANEPSFAEVADGQVSLHNGHGELARYRYRIDTSGRVRLSAAE